MTQITTFVFMTVNSVMEQGLNIHLTNEFDLEVIELFYHVLVVSQEFLLLFPKTMLNDDFIPRNNVCKSESQSDSVAKDSHIPKSD